MAVSPTVENAGMSNTSNGPTKKERVVVLEIALPGWFEDEAMNAIEACGLPWTCCMGHLDTEVSITGIMRPDEEEDIPPTLDTLGGFITRVRVTEEDFVLTTSDGAMHETATDES